MGQTFDDPDVTAVAAATEAGLDYTMTKRGLLTRNSKGHTMNVPGQYALVSSQPHGYGAEDGAGEEVIAIVGREFEPVQNMHLAELLDQAGLTGPHGLYSIDVAGKSADGRLVFWALKDRERVTIKGDDYQDHWLLLDGKDGNRALTMALTPIRTVCSNALTMAVSGASIKVGIHHTKTAQAELEWWLNIAPQLQAASRKSKDLLTRMASIEVTAEQEEEVLSAAYPAPKVKGKAQLYQGLTELKLTMADEEEVERAHGKHGKEAMRVLARRQLAHDLFVSYADNAEERNIAGTLLGIVNAVADSENHREPSSKQENAPLSNMVGARYRAQAGAMKAALAIAR